jgi:thiamine biosynthesis lipoprotein
MEIDLGGIGKEYAVDRASAQAAAATDAAVLVNFGGDLLARGPRRDGRPWLVGVEDPGAPGKNPLGRLELASGALATSGDARRHVLVRGRRLGHILDPRTGWPVEGAPRSVTVMAATCIEAGTLATLAILRGADAARFLEEQGVQHWIVA